MKDLQDITAVFGGDQPIIKVEQSRAKPVPQARLMRPKLVSPLPADPLVSQDGYLPARGRDLVLASYSAILILDNESASKKKEESAPVVEIAARLRDRSIQIKDETDGLEPDNCGQEEGTAWGSTAITVRTPTTTTATTTSTTTSETQTQTSTVTTTGTSTSSTRTTSTSSTVTTTTRPCACFEICCEDRPVQGVHLPVNPNVCPEWWQGKMTGRAWHANASGLPSNLEDSLKTKRSQRPEVECADCDASSGIAARSPAEQVSFQQGPNHFFQKWSSSNREPASSSPPLRLEAVGLLTMCALLLTLALAMLRRSSTLPWVQSEEGADRDAGLTDQLVQGEEPIDGCL